MVSLNDLPQPAKNIARIVFLIIVIAIFVAIFQFGKEYLISKGYLSSTNIPRKAFIQDLKFDYKIIRVVDGDTLEIKRLDGKAVEDVEKVMKVRLIGINSPESVDPRRPVECFGKEASAYMKNVAEGRVAALEFDFTQNKFDDYGRLLAYIFVKDSGLADNNVRFLNEEMIKEGYAYEYTYNYPYKYQAQFKLLENTARINYVGLWSTNTCSGLKTPVGSPAN
ncbi:MAG TPA: thermonuclease family protein [Candidatus Paceibacterota bacterium]|nr:thermonuclease family protein [Candidatus Paceibacterota bacterium]